jgi:hypothetical protein
MGTLGCALPQSSSYPSSRFSPGLTPLPRPATRSSAAPFVDDDGEIRFAMDWATEAAAVQREHQLLRPPLPPSLAASAVALSHSLFPDQDVSYAAAVRTARDPPVPPPPAPASSAQAATVHSSRQLPTIVPPTPQHSSGSRHEGRSRTAAWAADIGSLALAPLQLRPDQATRTFSTDWPLYSVVGIELIRALLSSLQHSIACKVPSCHHLGLGWSSTQRPPRMSETRRLAVLSMNDPTRSTATAFHPACQILCNRRRLSDRCRMHPDLQTDMCSRITVASVHPRATITRFPGLRSPCRPSLALTSRFGNQQLPLFLGRTTLDLRTPAAVAGALSASANFRLGRRPLPPFYRLRRPHRR